MLRLIIFLRPNQNSQKQIEPSENNNSNIRNHVVRFRASVAARCSRSVFLNDSEMLSPCFLSEMLSLISYMLRL